MCSPRHYQEESEDQRDYRGFEQHDENDDAHSLYSDSATTNNHTEDADQPSAQPAVAGDTAENEDLQRGILATIKPPSPPYPNDAEASFEASLRRPVEASLQESETHERVA